MNKELILFQSTNFVQFIQPNLRAKIMLVFLRWHKKDNLCMMYFSVFFKVPLFAATKLETRSTNERAMLPNPPKSFNSKRDYGNVVFFGEVFGLRGFMTDTYENIS